MNLLLLIGPPDSSVTLVAGMLATQPRVAPIPPGRLLTALAHVGVEANVDKAPYDHILAGPSQRLFLSRVDGGLGAWPAACRVYLQSLLDTASAQTDAPWLLDAAPEYARLLPFVERVAPDATLILVLRNPVGSATELLSVAGDAHNARQWLASYRQLARVLRARGDEVLHLGYESLLAAPEAELSKLADRLGGAWSVPEALAGALEHARLQEADWPRRLAADRCLLRRVRTLMESLERSDLDVLRFPWPAAWKALEVAGGPAVRARRHRTAWHVLVRGIARRARAFTLARPVLAEKVRKLKLACEVLLRDS